MRRDTFFVAQGISDAEIEEIEQTKELFLKDDPELSIADSEEAEKLGLV